MIKAIKANQSIMLNKYSYFENVAKLKYMRATVTKL